MHISQVERQHPLWSRGFVRLFSEVSTGRGPTGASPLPISSPAHRVMAGSDSVPGSGASGPGRSGPGGPITSSHEGGTS